MHRSAFVPAMFVRFKKNIVVFVVYGVYNFNANLKEAFACITMGD